MCHRRDYVVAIGVAAALFGLWPGAVDAQTLYGVTQAASPRELVTINTATGAGTVVGTLTPTYPPSGLAFRGPKLYTFDGSARRVRELDPATGNSLSLIDIGLPATGWNGGGLAFRSNGIGFLGRGPTGTEFYSFDITAGTNTLITAAQDVGLGPLACNAADVLYGVSFNKLYTINQTTGALTLVGDTLISGRAVSGITFDAGGNLFACAIIQTAPFPSFLYRLDTATGVGTLIGAIGIDAVQSLAFGTPGPVAAGVTVAQSGGSTNVAEGGATDTYTIVLNSAPTANVTITINPGTQLTLSPATLTFTPANWNTPQTVTVTAVDDALVEGVHTGTVSHTATSTDAAYNGIAIAGVTVNITDNDGAPPPPPTGGAPEGAYGGSSGPSGSEGGFGFGRSRRAVLAGPFGESPGRLIVLNVAHRPSVHAATEEPGIPVWSIAVTALVLALGGVLLGSKAR